MERTIRCENCGTQNEEDDLFCAECGYKLSVPKELWLCVNCGQKNTAAVCTQCGMSEKESKVKSTFQVSVGFGVYHSKFHKLNKTDSFRYSVFLNFTSKKINLNDYSDDCFLNPCVNVKNLTDSPQTVVVEISVNGNSFKWDTALKAGKDRTIVFNDMVISSQNTYEYKVFIDGVSVAKDFRVVSEGNSDFYKFIKTAFSYSGYLNFKSIKKTEQEEFTYFLDIKNKPLATDPKNAQYMSETCVISFAQTGPTPGKTWTRKISEVHGKKYPSDIITFNNKNETNEVIYYVNGIEVLRETFEMVID